ncbi:MAG TPA: polysaccharide lyase family protein [Bryobacteraceae bacterium]|jgi:hypothetical protein|nr:polysaccharide lyase family protein [Bryobacteraceae bacterium]
MRRKTLLPVLLLLPLFRIQAQPHVVWQIGEFNESPVEFAKGFKDSVTFQVGTSNTNKDWPGRQRTGSTYKVLFSLNSVDRSYSLKIATLIDQPRIPVLDISINGHEGKFFLHPKLSYSRSDFSYAFDPHESQSTIEIDVPNGFLKQGQNAIAITCADDPPTPSGSKEIGGISYDALSLESENLPQEHSRDATVDVEPTIFYRQSQSGLTEILDAFARFPGPWRAGSIELELNGKRYDAKLTGGEFGEEKISFEVPEFAGTLKGIVRLNGTSKSLDVTLSPKRKWTIFVVPHTHLDIGYTDYQGKVAETQARVLTQAGNLIKEHPDFRFSMDGSWNLEQLLNTRPAEKRKEILDLIRAGKMAMPVQYCNLLTGYASLETLYRSLYESKALAKKEGLPFEYANITDVPTYSGSYPSVLASSGVRYWVAASNNDRAPIFYYDHWNEHSPFWWVGPDGQKVLFWYSRHYMQVQTLFGLPPQLNAIRESLPIYLQAYSHPNYKPDVAMIYGTQVENTDLYPSTATFADDWNKLYAFPKLTYSTFPDFFHYIDKNYSADLPTFKGDGGGYWEDGIASDAYFEAEDRVNQNRALSAEVLSTLNHSLDPNLNPPVGVFTHIWRNIILFAEHTWLSYNSVSQPDHDESVKQLRVKDDRANRAALEIEDVMDRSLSQLADQIHIPANTLVVFNSLNWKRSLLVETDLFEYPTIMDLSTHQEVPLEILYSKEHFLHVRFLAKDLPAVGYKCYSIAYGKQAPAAIPRSDRQIIENAFYRVTVDVPSGALSSVFDKELGQELVDSKSPYTFGQYLYVTGGDGDTQMINPFPALPPGELTVHGSSEGRYLGTETMPWGESTRLISKGIKTPEIETEILLFNDQKKIEFRYHVRKDYTDDKEAVYFAFPVSAAEHTFTFATQQGWIDPAQGLMKGGSLEWFNVQQWMAVHDSHLAVGIVPIDASLASFGDINRGKWPGTFQPRTSTIFSYAMNNYWHTNYRAGQGGDFTFRYAVTSAAKLDGGALTRLGLDEMRPPEVDYVVGQDKAGNPDRPLPAASEGFVETSGASVSVVTWKKAEDDNGTIMRLQELDGKSADVTIRLPHATIQKAKLCSGVENDIGDLPVQGNAIQVSLKPFEVVTVRAVIRE